MTDVSPLHGLRLRTPRLELRLGSHDEVLELGRLAEHGIHPPAEMPFFVAWTDRIGEVGFLDGFVEFHESAQSSWTPDDWSLLLHVALDGRTAGTPIVVCTIAIREVRVLSESLRDMGVLVVARPFEPALLLDAVRDGLRRGRSPIARGGAAGGHSAAE